MQKLNVVALGLIAASGVALGYENKTVTLSGLKSGSESVGLGISGCVPASVTAGGISLVKKSPGVFVVSEGTIAPNALIDVVVPSTCKGFGVSELKVDQLSQGDEELPAEGKKATPAPVAPPVPASGQAQPPQGQPLPPSTSQLQPMPQGTPTPAPSSGQSGSYFDQAMTGPQGAVVQVPGRVLQNSLNRHTDSVIQRSGNTQNMDEVTNNLGTPVEINRKGGTAVNRSFEQQTMDFKIHNQGTGKNGKGSNSVHALSGHTWIESGNSKSQSLIMDSFNRVNQSRVSGNIGGSVNISDETNNSVTETHRFTTPPPAPIHNHYQTNHNTTQQVVAPVVVRYPRGYVWTYYGWQPVY